MSEYWVSKKKYFCKYCEIYIADDAPSRTHHESGMRHKGNLERFIRGIYKSGEKRKKDLEEEKREMARVEQLANAAFAQDVGAGRAAAVAGPSTAPRKPAADLKSSNPYANYSTAESLGYVDPDAERIAKEEELRRLQGVAGEWQIVSTVPTPAPQVKEEDDSNEEDTKPDVASIGEKRPADSAPIPPHDEDARSFKIRKRTLGTGLGEIYDPGLLSIKVKKRPTEEVEKEEGASSTSTEGAAPTAPLPQFTPIQLKPGATSSSTNREGEGNSETKKDSQDNPNPPVDSATKWSKSSWAAAAPSGPMPAPPPPPPKDEEAKAPDVKEEEVEDVKPPVPAAPEPPAPMFKKRKAPASSARGRRAF